MRDTLTPHVAEATTRPAPSGSAGAEVLVVSMAVVDRPRDGGSLRTRAILDTLSGHGLRPRLTGQSAGHRRATAAADPVAASRLTRTDPRVDLRAAVLLARLLPVLLRYPSLSLLKRVSWGVLRDIARYERGAGARPSMADSAQMAIYLSVCRRPVALCLQNVEHELLLNYAAQAPTLLRRLVARYEARVMRSWEQHLLTLGLPVFVVSDHDRDLLARLAPQADIVVAPNGASDEFFDADVATQDTVVFVAHLGWQPNIDAAQWLVREVWPSVVAECPWATLQLVGRSPDRSVRELAAHRVEVHADVESVVPFVAGARVATAPLLTAGGTRIKIIEALACGTPVVATPLGALGLESAFTDDVLKVHGDAGAFAAAVVSLLRGEVGTSQATSREQADAFRWSRALAPVAEAVHVRVSALGGS